jgi:two-component system sensor kinase FixL
MQTAVDGILVVDANGIVQAFNPACEKLFGYGAEEIIGQSGRILLAESHRHEFGPSNGPGRETMGRRKDGTTFPVYLSRGEGEIDGEHMFVGIVHSLSERKQAEIVAREREALLSSILDTVPDAIITIDDKGLILSFSPWASELFGYRPEEVIGRNIKMLMPAPYRDQHDTYLADYQRTGIRKIIGIGRVAVGQRRDGTTFPIELSVGEVHAGGKTIYTGFVRDITERQGAERRVEALQAELLHVSRLNAMGQMSAAIAHELNQPLTAILNYMRAARRTLESAQENAIARSLEMVDKAANQVLRAGAIIRNLREFVEKRDSKRTPEDLNKVLEEAVALGFVGAAHLNMAITFDLDPDLPQVHIDRIQIQQVLINLIRNAIDAMHDSPTRALTIETRRGADDTVELTVSDTGPGLSPEVRARLFQPFVTTKDRGMGIGLTICKSIVDSHGGSIAALEGQAQGAAFRIRLPGFTGERGEA